MLFNTIQYAIFLPVVFSLYYFLPHKFRWIFLLIASCLFYMAFIPLYILILFLAIFIDYYAALRIDTSEGRDRKRYLIISVLSTCLLLFAFKYFNFFLENIRVIAKFLDLRYPDVVLKIILPIGLSFHTFQSLSYVFEVYYRRQKPERHFGIYALYVMFFPQLVAGPIERPQGLLNQLKVKREFSFELAKDGLRQILWGLVKKVIIADSLANLIGFIFTDYEHHNGSSLLMIAIMFSFQIYGDFSGYSDIAIGSAKLLGFRLMTNFNYPYFSKSIGEFWRRWHISLSSWFRDYLYIPLGGSKTNTPKRIRNVLITFGISGLWHGANWTFVVWGLLNGLYLIPSLLISIAIIIYPIDLLLAVM
jgi:alginate O-acetyltransferase complex protein AlgI